MPIFVVKCETIFFKAFFLQFWIGKMSKGYIVLNGNNN